jgi:hypothetical protein
MYCSLICSFADFPSSVRKGHVGIEEAATPWIWYVFLRLYGTILLQYLEFHALFHQGTIFNYFFKTNKEYL